MPVLSPPRTAATAPATGGNATMASTSGDVVHIAVINTVVSASANQNQNHLLQMSKETSLESIVAELCTQVWKLENPADYALAFESKEYVTEKAKVERIQNGTILKLLPSPRKLVHELLAKLVSSNDAQMQLYSFQAIEGYVSDYAVAVEFVKASGFDTVVKCIRDGTATATTMASLVVIFYELMRHDDLVSWEDDRIDSAFIGQIAANIETEKSKRGLSLDDRTLQYTLGILESLVCTASKSDAAQQAISVSSLLNYLQSDNQAVQWGALALFNTMFRLGDKTRKRKLKQVMEERNTRRVIVDYVIRKKPGDDLRHQLYVLQTLLLNLLEERMMTKVEANDAKTLEKIKELKKIAFDVQAQQGPQQRSREDYWKKLGFRNQIDPTQDFQETPPGMLALDLMFSFACNYSEQYTKVVLENSCRSDNHECPFARTSIEIVKLICAIIRIGQPPVDQGVGVFYPMFFTHENPLEELFAIVIQHVNKTWREMRATIEDFGKVMDVAKEQITHALRSAPLTLDDFRKGLKTYGEISDSRKEEAKHRGEREGKAIQHLRDVVAPEIVELIQQQRLNCLVEGTRFSKGKGKHFYCKLSPNHKAFHYGDWNDDSAPPPSLEHLPSKLQVAEIKDVLTGANCPHVRDLNRRARERNPKDHLAFSLVKESGDSVDFIAPDQKRFDYWTDGLAALLRTEMRSAESAKDLEMLLSMEVKIRLLDVEGIDIPEEAPVVPPLPNNFEFWQEA